jgi:hypothetical protein
VQVNIPCRGPERPPHPLDDTEASTAIGPRALPRGITVGGEGAWNARRPGGPKRRVRRKIHIGSGGKSPEIRAAGFTASAIARDETRASKRGGRTIWRRG